MASEETKPRQLELADYVRMLQKRMWFIGVVMAAAMIVGGLYVQASEELYRATALVVVRQRPRGFFWLTGEQTNIMPTFAMETHARIAQGTNVAKRVVKWLERPPYGYEPIIATAEKVRKSLEVSVIEPDLLRIDATSPDKIRAMRFAEASADAFEEENTEMRRQESSDACVFLKDQVEQAKNELDAVMQESVDLSREAGMVDVEAEATAATAELREYENQRRQIWAELRQAGAQLATLQETMASEQEVIVEENPVPNPAWTTVNGQLIGARIALAELRARYTEEHPGLQDASARVKELEEELANTPELLVMPQVRRSELIASLRRELAEAKVKVKVLEARHTALESIIADLRTRNLELPEGRQRWQSLNDRKELARNVYQSLSDELRQAKLNEQITQANAWVIDRPVSALLLRASLGRSLVFSGMLGLLCGVGLALLREALDDTIYTPDDLNRISDVRFLGVIPLRTVEDEELVTIAAPKSPAAEAYRTLRSNIRFALFDETAKTFVVCSAGPSEGKSFTAANLAVVCAQGGDSVILVDSDLRRPLQHRLFKLEASPGLTNMLVGDTELPDVLQDTGVPGLRLLSTGPLPPNPAELLDSRRMDDALKELSSAADIVILDSPPAIMLTDAGILASKVDRTIVVAESAQVTEHAFRDIMRIFEHARAKVLGTVLNKLRISAGDYYYYYYYDYDYGERATTSPPEAT